MDSVEILKGSELGDEEYLKAAILGWCVELVRVLSAGMPSSDSVNSGVRADACSSRLTSSLQTISWTRVSLAEASHVGTVRYVP